MTKEEYIKRMNEDKEWAPGWDAIQDEFERIYPQIEPSHYASLMTSRAIFGGDEFIDGYSIYNSGKGYQHIVTFGMSELYADEEAFGEEYSKWGYEMTMKLKADKAEDCLWALDMISNLARYTFKSKNFFEPEEYIAGSGTSLHIGTESMITALITVADTSAETQDTVHGELGFIQLVGITEAELTAIKEDGNNLKVLIELMKKDNPELITDMDRNFSYL
ncbi:MAG: suppressor of fused domain protein [Acutalibacteraceae bacterium]|nr:suppressor of fused domain protein [Acutalibacteraceae bacterium]